MTATATPSSRLRGRATGWPGVALVGIAFLVAMLGTTLPTPLYLTYAAELHFGELTTTIVFATYAVGVIAALLAFGHWSDQLGRRPLLALGLALSAASAVAFLMPASLPWLYVGRVLSGLSAGVFSGTATATVIDLAPEDRKGAAGLVAAAVNMGGLGVGPLLSGTLAELAPDPTHLVFAVDLVLVVIAAISVLLVAEPVRRSSRLALAPRGLTVPAEVRGTFVQAAIAGFAGFAVLGLFGSVSPAFLGDLLHHRSPALTGVVVAVIFTGSVIGQVVSSRLGLRTALPAGCALLVVALAMVAVSLPTRSLALLVVGAAVAGLGQGTSFRAGLGAVSGGVPPEQRGQVTSTYFVLLYTGISLPVVGEGALATHAGLVTAGVTFAVVVAALAGLALVLTLRAARA